MGFILARRILVGSGRFIWSVQPEAGLGTLSFIACLNYVSRRPGHYWSGSVAAACGLYSVGSQCFSQLSGADWCCHPRVVLCVILRFAYVSVKDVDQLRVIEIRRLCFLNLFKVRVSDLGTLIVENQVSCNSAFSLCLR